MRNPLILLPVLLLLLLAEASAQPFTRDTSFSLDINFFQPGSGGRVGNILELPDEKLLVTGHYSEGIKRGMTRFFSNGTYDPSFQPPSNLNIQQTHFATPAEYGYWVMYDFFYIVKLGQNGQQIDPSYTHNLQFTDLTLCPFSRPVILHDGSLLVGGSDCGYPDTNPNRWMNLLRVLPDGHVDTTFQHDTNGSVFTLLRYDSSRVLVAGSFTSYDGVPITRICRIDTLGNLDTSFNSIISINSGLVSPVFVQADGKIIITGDFNIQNHAGPLDLVRLHPDGSLDSTFNNFNNVYSTDGSIGPVCPTSDGGFLIGGSFSNYQGEPKGCIVKTDSNGFIESQYFAGSGFDAPPPLNNSYLRVINIVRASDDQYYVVGSFSGFNGQTVQPIIRLNGPQTVGIDPAEVKKAAVTVQPNPARERITVTLSSDAPIFGIGSLRLTDLAGKEIKSALFNGASTDVEVSQLPQGLYVLTVTDTQNRHYQQKLVIQH